MIDSEATLKARLTWVQMYEHTQNANLTCRRCGISYPPLRKWWRRYQTEGEDRRRRQKAKTEGEDRRRSRLTLAQPSSS